jgi:RNA polymerase sigma-70 factor (ECF subfamily)
LGSPHPIFEALWRKHGSLILGLLVRHVRDRGAAEDLWQETFYAAACALERGEELRDEAAWLRSVAIRKAVDYARRLAARPPTSGDANSSAAVESQPARVEPSGLEWEDDLAQLPACERTALLLAYREGYAMTEIAALFAVPVGTVKTWLFRARARLRARFTEDAS